MIEATRYPEEEKRMEAVKSLGLLDTPIEERFERITRMVCKMLDVPVALFNLIDSDRQHYKSAQGLPGPDASLKAAFCTHALEETDMMLVPDATKDKRFHDNPFVTGEFLNIAFYAGIPIRTANGMPVGTLCAIDYKPRDMSAAQLATLRDLSVMVENELRTAKSSDAQRQLIGDVNDSDRAALLDPISRLWNEDGLYKILEHKWNNSKDKKAPATIALVRLDDFKKVTDLLGRQVADGIIRVVAKKLLQAFHLESTAGRSGPDEFMIVMDDNDAAGFNEKLEHVRTLMHEDPFIAGVSKKYPVKISAGMATKSSHEGNARALVEAAKKSLS